jgi:Skp family chaperone for outer membrane proteins
MTPYVFLLALSLMPLAMSTGLASAPSQAPPANPTGTAVLGFKERLAEYVKVHKEAQSKVPKLTETNAANMQGREAALAATIKKLRPHAKEGDVFGQDFRAVLAREVRRDFLGRSAADRKAVMQEQPLKMRLSVNMTYPTDKPLKTFPGQLLQKLPELPPELEYRIVGHHIVLRDSTANLIVDVARDIVPKIAG